jgi:hypothetical protein
MAMAFAKFMAGTAGRAVRILAGVAIILVGLFVVGDTGGLILAAVGILPIVAGVLNVCFIAPLLRVPFSGKQVL